MQNVSLHPMTEQAYRLFHESVQAFSEIETEGIRIDVDLVRIQIDELTERIEQIDKRIEEDPIVQEWKSIYKKEFNINSATQLAYVLFEVVGEEPIKTTEKGAASVDKEVLHKLSKKYSFVADILESRRLKKARDTYLKNLLEESVNGVLRPMFNLHTTRTYRSSSSNINFQNIPKRDKEIQRLIRKTFIPRGDDYVFGGVDYSSQEVRIAACYHKDPNMLKYLKEKGDMHKDIAMDCFMCLADLVTKEIRNVAKNKFVFPQFYGDYYVNCASAMWEQIEELDLKLTNGMSLKDHLRKKGITTYKEFEEHIKQVEYKFWNKRFPIYNKWKDEWYNDYMEKGYIDLYTGFRCQGYMRKNEVINYPIQGSAFHCLLWSLVKLHKWLKKYKMKTKIVGQIHDEIVIDLHVSEMEVVLEKIVKIMTHDIRKEWTWIIVPLEVEAEFCEPGGSWFDKKVVSLSL